MNRLILSTFFFLFTFTIFCQDTIYVTPQVSFSAKKGAKYFGKGYHGEYGREDIILSDSNKIVAYCYYMDEERNCLSWEYKILNDSILWVNYFHKFKEKDTSGIIWKYKKEEDGRYFIHNQDSSVYRYGYATSLIPLEFDGKLTVTLPDKKTVVWHEYRSYKPLKYRFLYIAYLHFSPIKGKLYEYDKIDSPPLMPNGDTLSSVYIDYRRTCACEPMSGTDRHIVSFIVDKEGYISNIENAIGELKMYCPYSYQEVILRIHKKGKLKPATKNGKPVNVRWFIEVIETEKEKESYFGTPFQVHPVYKDTKENRYRFIKSVRKRKQKN